MHGVICSDIHGNAAALQAVLDDIARGPQPDVVVVAGDLVEGGPRPAEALALLRAIPNARFVMGNTDEYVLDRRKREAGLDFTRRQIGVEGLQFLASLSFSQELAVGPHQLLVVHANPRNLEDPIGPDSPDGRALRRLLDGVQADLVAFGHVHIPFVRQFERWMLIDVASVGLPRDGDRRAVYVTLTWQDGKLDVRHHRVTYDWDAVAADFTVAGHPEARHLAKRLLKAKY